MASIDLHSLSDGERGVLRLLAEGHTVKSIAMLTGRSAHSVNERLRDARRKTGAGSSRELARLLREQENRDEKIGIAASWADDARQPAQAGGHRRYFPKGFVVAISIGGIGAALLAIAGQNNGLQVAADPASPEALRFELSRQTRDANWAEVTEVALGRRYVAIKGIEPDLFIHCATTLCEVTGRLRNESSAAVNRTMHVMQGSRLAIDLHRIGLTSAAQSFAFDREGKQGTFAAFWKRSDAH